jgi:stage II sporulation protein AA (anti-sigma F factor antagonist)
VLVAVASSKHDNVLVITLGDLSGAAAASAIDACCDEATASGRIRVTFDLRALTSLDGRTLNALMRAKRRLDAAGGEVRLRAPSPSIARQLHAAGVDGELPIDV